MCNTWNASTTIVLSSAYYASINITASLSANDDCQEHAPVFTPAVHLRVVVLSIMAVVSLVGNFATMWNIKQSCVARRATRHTWSAIYFLIFHLSVADVLVTVFCIFGEAAWSYTVEWVAGAAACKIVKFLQMFSLYLSTFVLVLIGVDRWIAVKYPWKTLNMARRCYRLIATAWILAAVLSVPQLIIFDVVKGPFVEEFHQCVTYSFYTAYWQEQLYTTFTLLFMFVLPLAILIGTYVATFRTISASQRIFSPELTEFQNGMDIGQTRKRQQLINRAKVKSLRISVAIVAAFIICWTPYYVMMITFMFLHPDRKFSDGLQSAIFFFGSFNSLANPLIYGAFHVWPTRRQCKPTQSSITKEGSSQKTALSGVATSPRPSANGVKCNGTAKSGVKEKFELLNSCEITNVDQIKTFVHS